MNADVASAYGAARQAWADGPMRVYGAVAEALCRWVDVPLAGALVLDVGCGTGAASASLRRRGAEVVALDFAEGMQPMVAGDARRLPFCDKAFDAVVSAFCLNHLDDPVRALVEARRVLRPGGAGLVAVWSAADWHPAKAAVEGAAAAAGWTAPAWYAGLRDRAVGRLATVERALAAAGGAGIDGATAVEAAVPVPGLDAAALVAWRAGMPHLAPFFSGLDPAARVDVLADARGRLGDDPPPLVRSVIVLSWCERVACRSLSR